MRLTLAEKKIVKKLTEHAIELEKEDRIQYHRGKKREERKELQKLLGSILKKVTKDIEEEDKRDVKKAV
jgi:hypothetical protein